jgi:hypothetical protein
MAERAAKNPFDCVVSARLILTVAMMLAKRSRFGRAPRQ